MVRYIDELQLSGKRVFIRVDFNVPLDEARNVTDDTRIREALPTIKKALAMGGEGDPRLAPGPPQGRGRQAVAAAGRQDAHRAAGPEHEVLFADDCVGEGVTKMAQGPARAARCCCSRTCASTRKRRPTTRASPSSWPPWPTSTCNDAFGTAHRAHASTAGMVPLREGEGGGLADQEGDRAPGQGGAQRREALRGDPGWRQGLRQDQGHREPAAQVPTACSSAAPWPTPSSRRRASRSARAGSRRTSSSWPRKLIDTAARLGVELVLPIDHVCGTSPDEKSEARGGRRARHPRGPDGARHRPQDPRRSTRSTSAPRARCCGTGRWASSRSRSSRRGTRAVAEAMAKQHRGADGGGRRRQRGGGQRVRPGREDDARVHRRWRLARVPRGARAARHQGAGGREPCP